MWYYLNYTDESLHRSFSVSFDPKDGCSVSAVGISRAEVEKLPLHVLTGKVVRLYRNYPNMGDNGILCDVQFNRDGRDCLIGVAVATLDRVKGIPKIGAGVRVAHHGPEVDYIFVGSRSLYLESMIFTDNGKQAAPPDGDRPSK